MEIQIETADIPVVHLRGDIDLSACPRLRTALEGLLAGGTYEIVLDMAGVRFVDSAGIGVLMDIARRVRDHGGEVYLAQMIPFVRRAFEIMRLLQLFSEHDTVPAALEDIGRRRTNF